MMRAALGWLLNPLPVHDFGVSGSVHLSAAQPFAPTPRAFRSDSGSQLSRGVLELSTRAYNTLARDCLPFAFVFTVFVHFLVATNAMTVTIEFGNTSIIADAVLAVPPPRETELEPGPGVDMEALQQLARYYDEQRMLVTDAGDAKKWQKCPQTEVRR
jgi:hypothetical protein